MITSSDQQADRGIAGPEQDHRPGEHDREHDRQDDRRAVERMPRDCGTQQRPAHHRRDRHDREQQTGRGLADTLALDEVRVAPEQAHRGDAELGREVGPEPEPGAGLGPCLADVVGDLGQTRRPGVGHLERGVDHHEVQHHAEHDADQPTSRRTPASSRTCSTHAPSAPRRRSCRPGPSSPVSWVMIGLRAGGNHSITSRSTETKIIESPMPTRTAGAEPEREGVGEGEGELADRHQRQTDRQHPLGAEVGRSGPRPAAASRRTPAAGPW